MLRWIWVVYNSSLSQFFFSRSMVRVSSCTSINLSLIWSKTSYLHWNLKFTRYCLYLVLKVCILWNLNSWSFHEILIHAETRGFTRINIPTHCLCINSCIVRHLSSTSIFTQLLDRLLIMSSESNIFWPQIC